MLTRDKFCLKFGPVILLNGQAWVSSEQNPAYGSSGNIKTPPLKGGVFQS
jgi:hypothetical protein